MEKLKKVFFEKISDTTMQTCKLPTPKPYLPILIKIFDKIWTRPGWCQLKSYWYY